MAGSNVLGEYLRARRELVDPADAGLRVTGVRRTPGPGREVVPTGIRQLLDALELPAFVESRTFDVLAVNPLATALLGIRPGGNRLRSVFLDAAERDLYLDGEQALAGMVAAFRASVGTEIDDPRTAELVDALSAASEPFRRLWARHDVQALAGGATRLRHPQVGLLELRREKLPLADTDGQILAIYHAERGSPSARSLALLGALAATDGSVPDARTAARA